MILHVDYFRSRRRGGVLLESLMALAVIGVALALTAEGLALLNLQRKQNDLQTLALLELDRVLERVAATPWADVTAAEIESWKLEGRLPAAAKLIAKVTEEAGQPKAKRVEVTLECPTARGSVVAPSLVAWRYQQETQP